MIEDAEGSRNPDDPDNREGRVQKIPALSAQEHTENLGANSANQQDRRRQGHAQEEFDLVMEQPAIVEDADSRDQRPADENAHDLRARRSVESKEHRNHHGGVHRQAAKKRDWLEMNFAWPGQVDHSYAQRKCTNRNHQH